MKNTRVLWLLAIFFIVAPMVGLATDVVINSGPDVLANSANGLAWGGKFWATDSTAVDNDFWAYYAVHALAVLPPDGDGGYAYAVFHDVSDNYNHVQTLGVQYPNANFPTAGSYNGQETVGSKLNTQLGYSGSVDARVDTYGPHGEFALAYANLGAGAADFHFDQPKPNVAGAERYEASNFMIGGTGQLSALLLPSNGEGDAATTGFAYFDQKLLGDNFGPNGNDQALEIYGNVNGGTQIGGNDEERAHGDVIGLAAEGTIVAGSRIGDSISGVTGLSLATSGKLTFAGAEGNLKNPADADSGVAPADVNALATGETYGGAWDGSFPAAIESKFRDSNENVYTDNVGEIESIASAPLANDLAATLGLTGDIAFHVASPFEVPEQVKGLGSSLTNVLGDSNVAAITDAVTTAADNMQTTSQFKGILNAGSQAGNMNELLGSFTPEIKYVNNEVQSDETVADPATVVADIALTGAVAFRDNNVDDPSTANHVSAETYIKPGTHLESFGLDGDHFVSDTINNLDQASGAHVVRGENALGSIGLTVQGAASDYTSPFPSLIGGTYGTANGYFLATLGPSMSGQRWDDAGSRAKMDSGDMIAATGTKAFEQTNTGYDAIAWIVGDDPNEQLRGGEYTSTFTNPGGAPMALGRNDGLVYAGPFGHFGQHRASLFASIAGQVAV